MKSPSSNISTPLSHAEAQSNPRLARDELPEGGPRTACWLPLSRSLPVIRCSVRHAGSGGRLDVHGDLSNIHPAVRDLRHADRMKRARLHKGIDHDHATRGADPIR